MALEFGFSLYEHDPAAKALWDAKYKALSEDDKKFYHGSLPYYLMIADIGIITKATIPHLVSRLFIVMPDLEKEHSYDRVCEHLRTFIGFKANVLTIDTAAFIRKRVSLWRLKLPKMNYKQAADLRRGAEEEVLVEEIPSDKLLEFTGTVWRNESAKARYQSRMAAGK